jgi:hypothetical protein
MRMHSLFGPAAFVPPDAEDGTKGFVRPPRQGFETPWQDRKTLLMLPAPR